jgi:hypothetical protein
MVHVPTSNDGAVLAFVRTAGEDRVLVAANFSMRSQDVELRGKDFNGVYTDLFENKSVRLDSGSRLKLKPWAYEVFAAGRLPASHQPDVPSAPAAEE